MRSQMTVFRKCRKIYKRTANICSNENFRHMENVSEVFVCRIVSVGDENCESNHRKNIWQPYLAEYP